MKTFVTKWIAAILLIMPLSILADDAEDVMEVIIEEAEKVKNLGFTGKAAIHPSQIDFINDAFEPTKEEKEEAKKVLEEYQKMDDLEILAGSIFQKH